MEKINKLIIFIIGTTASGKTKLSLELAKQLNGEIISSDSMQMYKKADIMTAKVTKKEKIEISHHLVDCLELDNMNFTRNQFFFKAKNIIDNLYEVGKVPIIIGGTHYYTESLLFNQEIDNDESLCLLFIIFNKI